MLKAYGRSASDLKNDEKFSKEVNDFSLKHAVYQELLKKDNRSDVENKFIEEHTKDVTKLIEKKNANEANDEKFTERINSFKGFNTVTIQ